jgi:hypothetical protein
MGTGAYPIRTEQVEFKTEQSASRVSGLRTRLWIAAKNRRIFAIRTSYFFDSEGVRGNSNSRFAIRNLRAATMEKAWLGANLP